MKNNPTPAHPLDHATLLAIAADVGAAERTGPGDQLGVVADQLGVFMAVARRVRPAWSVLDVLQDPLAPQPAWFRALGRLVADWPSISADYAELEQFDETFQRLLDAANEHAALVRSNAELAELADSRGRLDQLRLVAAQCRPRFV